MLLQKNFKLKGVGCMERYTEEMKLWLFDLAHGNLKDQDIISGFIKHYILFDCTMHDVKRDILYHTVYGELGVTTALVTLSDALNGMISKKAV